MYIKIIDPKISTYIYLAIMVQKYYTTMLLLETKRKGNSFAKLKYFAKSQNLKLYIKLYEIVIQKQISLKFQRLDLKKQISYY